MEAGLVRSLGRPGANVTGLAVPSDQLVAKHVELLKEVQPRLSRVLVLWDQRGEDGRLRMAEIEAALRRLAVRVQTIDAFSVGELDRVFGGPTASRPEALLLLGPGTRIRGEVARFALQRRVAAVGQYRHMVAAGGLMAYGPDPVSQFERAALYTAKVLRGVPPSELPVEEPARYVLSVSKIDRLEALVTSTRTLAERV